MGFVIESACCCGGTFGPCCSCDYNAELQECFGHGPFLNDVLNITIESACGTSVGQLVYTSSGLGPQVWQGVLTLHCWHTDGQGNVSCVDVDATISLICSNGSSQFNLEIFCSGTPDVDYVADPPGKLTQVCNPFLFQLTNAHPDAFDCCFGNVEDSGTYNEHVNITITNAV